uniref:Putative secreted protein n=1 Tax=Anopheles darlingi TaxID=43151 RepID=A0A2M4DQV7_ANODA
MPEKGALAAAAAAAAAGWNTPFNTLKHTHTPAPRTVPFHTERAAGRGGRGGRAHRPTLAPRGLGFSRSVVGRQRYASVAEWFRMFHVPRSSWMVARTTTTTTLSRGATGGATLPFPSSHLCVCV